MLFSGTPTADQLLKDAIKLKFTNNGEMFSAQWLLETMKENISASSINPTKIRSYIYDGNLDSEFIQEKLKRHCMILVPYDADKNHSPCNQNGHKAHWCLVCGFLIEDNNDVSSSFSSLNLNLNPLVPFCAYFKNGSSCLAVSPIFRFRFCSFSFSNFSFTFLRATEKLRISDFSH